MRAFDAVKAYWWPTPPRSLSAEARRARVAALAGHAWIGWRAVPPAAPIHAWTRQEDRLARQENRAWLRQHLKTYARRWTALSVGCVAIAVSSAGRAPIAETAFTVASALAVGQAFAFWWAHHEFNR